MAKLKIEYIPTADLIPYARNARTHSDAFDAYSAGAEEITALILGVVEVFEKSIPLSELRTLDILPPQSFCYLPEVLRNVCVCA